MTRYEQARQYVDAGLSVIPILANGSKQPPVPWKQYQERKPTDDELRHWFDNGFHYGIAVVCGPVSGNLEVLDFDNPAVWEQFEAANRATIESKQIPCVRTPSGGAHLYLFRSVAGPNRKVAQADDGKTLIEVRGQGGYALMPGSPPECHPTGREYVWLTPLQQPGA